MGVDDYIVKLFNLEILMYKIKSVLRRVYGEYSISGDEIVNLEVC